MQLERALIVVNRRSDPDVGYPDFDVRHMEGPLKCSGMVDNIDILYYSDYTPNCDETLINYCLQKKPEMVLLCLQGGRQMTRSKPSPNAVWKITHQLNIPTVVFWFDIHSDEYAELLVSYSHSVTLNLMCGADASSHKTIPLEGTNYVYASLAYDESYFNIPEGVRDIDIGFLGSVKGNRSQWIEGLNKCGFSTYVSGGQKTADWMSFEEYCQLMSRMKIALNFSSLSNQPITLGERRRNLEVLYWLASQLKTWLSVLSKNPVKLKYTIPALKFTTSALVTKPRYMIRARVWEALWLRAFLLEEDNPVTSLYFEPYVDYVPYTTLPDLVNKVRYYLENEEERDRIRMHGRATVEKYYNARIYWENILETIGIPSDNQFHHHPGEVWNKAHFENWYLGNSSIERSMTEL